MFQVAYASEGRATVDLTQLPPDILEFVPKWHEEWVQEYNSANG